MKSSFNPNQMCRPHGTHGAVQNQYRNLHIIPLNNVKRFFLVSLIFPVIWTAFGIVLPGVSRRDCTNGTVLSVL